MPQLQARPCSDLIGGGDGATRVRSFPRDRRFPSAVIPILGGRDDALGEPLRVLVADSHPIFRAGLRGILDAHPLIDLVGQAADGREAISLAETLSPDVAVLDVALAIVDGIEVARTIRKRKPGIAVVLLTGSDDEDHLFRAANIGVAAFYRKDVSPDDFCDGICRVGSGQCLISENLLSRPLVASRVLNQFRELESADKADDPLYVPLSAREIEVLDYIARGNSNKEIARALKISDQTVKNHITSILRKLAVNDRTQAVVYALRRGWIDVNDL
ncbi:MAG TPA: response regulator transcription factor [Chloroflexota bacterium]|nr:response regulator transcription factor [Chloroflexota bacterium]